jgi:hypothetical protein
VDNFPNRVQKYDSKLTKQPRCKKFFNPLLACISKDFESALLFPPENMSQVRQPL